MNEKEKMILGELYYANNEELIKERKKAKDLCYKYNNLKPSQEKERKKRSRKKETNRKS